MDSKHSPDCASNFIRWGTYPPRPLPCDCERSGSIPVREECCGACGSAKECKLSPSCLHHQDVFSPKSAEWEEEWREKLVESLDKHFPKGQCKERGKALVVYADTVMLTRDLLASQKREMVEEIRAKIEAMKITKCKTECTPPYVKHTHHKYENWTYNVALNDVLAELSKDQP